MEDAHSYVFDYAGVHGQGFFAVFDGHAGREAADWCGQNFHEVSPRNFGILPRYIGHVSFSTCS
jgi:serine/threonine protein phosphatase PrpC